MTDLPYLIIYLGIFMLSFLAVFGLVKARRKNEPVYYWSSGTSFLLLIAFVAVLFNNFLLFYAVIGLAVVISIVWLPQVRELNREELVKQKQETDVSAPLRLKDFLTFKGLIKLRATHGLRTAVTLYLLTNTGILAAAVLVFIALGLMTPIMAFLYSITFTVFYFLISYRQVWKALKEP